jgi:flagellar secretion chaperone FliS
MTKGENQRKDVITTMKRSMGNCSRFMPLHDETAKKEKLTTMLLEGAVKFLLLTRTSGRGPHDLWDYRTNILKAESLILELIGSLNLEKGGEIAVNLHKLSIYMIDALSQAIDERRDDKVAEVLNILIPLKETWKEAPLEKTEEIPASRQELMAGGMGA